MTGNYKVGDKIQILLTGFGDFSATVQRITKDSIMFMFDECVMMYPMKLSGPDEEKFEGSSLFVFLNGTLKDAFPEEFKKNMYDLSIPSIGMMIEDKTIRTYNRPFYDLDFSRPLYKQMSMPDSVFKFFESDSDEFLPLMKDINNLRTTFKGVFVEQWLRNANISDFSGTFACIDSTGSIKSGNPKTPFGVRPVFWMPYHKLCPFCEQFGIGDTEHCYPYAEESLNFGRLEGEMDMTLWHLEDDNSKNHRINVDLTLSNGHIVSSVEIPIKYCPVCGKELK